MVQINLPIKEYNIEKHDQELRQVATFDGLVISEDNIWAILIDDATQQDIDAVLAIAQAHDPGPTEEQVANTQAESALAEFSETRKDFERLIPLALAFDKALHALREQDQATTNAVYNAWRSIFSNLSSGQRQLMADFILPFNANLPVQEPDPLTEEYRARFNSAIRDFCLYIGLRSQIGR